MSLLPVEDPDPLLEFSDERGATESSAPPLEPAIQPVAATEDRPSIQQPPETSQALRTKVEHLERALDRSKEEVSSLKSEVATLVRTVADIRKQISRPAASAVVAQSPARARTASAIAGLIIGAALGIGGWMYLTSEGDIAIGPAAPVSAQALVDPKPASQPAIEPEAPQVTDAVEAQAPAPSPLPAPKAVLAPKPHQAPSAPPVRQAPPAPQASDAPKYVGILSIDSDPDGEVFLNGHSVGRTPLRLPNLRAGSHLIWIERDGYRRFTRVVQVPSDRVTRLSAELEPLAAR